MKDKRLAFANLLWVFMVLIGCTGPNSQNTPFIPTPALPSMTPISTEYKSNAVPTITPNPTEIYVHSFPNPSTPSPTMDQETQLRFFQLLHSDLCHLPCYLGIIPGKTKWEEAKTTLKGLGAFFSFNTDANNFTVYNVHLDMGDESVAGLIPGPNSGVTDVRIIQSLHFIIEDGIVQKIWTSVSTRKFISKFQEYWSRYTLREVFLQFGAPDQVLTEKRDAGGDGYGLYAVYEKYGLVFSVNGSAQDGFICPKSEKTSIGLDFSITNPDSGLDLYAPAFAYLQWSDVYVPIDEVLGIGKQEVYARLIANSQACFEIKS